MIVGATLIVANAIVGIWGLIAYRRELAHFIGAIVSGTPPLIGGEDGVKALELADAALESLRTGRAVKI